MRYIKVLLLMAFLFFAMVFFFQNQVPLSQDVILTLNLFFIPPFTSIPLPFYFIVIASFLLGSVLTLCLLVWDRWTISAKSMKKQWKINSMQKEIDTLKSQMAKDAREFADFEAKSVEEGHKEDAARALAPKKLNQDEKKPA